MRQSRSSVFPETSTWRARLAPRFGTRSPWLIGTTGMAAVLAAAGLMACSTPAGSSAHALSARPGSGQKVPGQAVTGKPPAGLQRAAGQLVADGVPGVIIMTRRGKQVSDVVAGHANKATSEPMRPQDRVHIGSITKTFTATVVLQLAAERRLSLNDSVQKWLPGIITATTRPASPSASCCSTLDDHPGQVWQQNAQVNRTRA